MSLPVGSAVRCVLLDTAAVALCQVCDRTEVTVGPSGLAILHFMSAICRLSPGTQATPTSQSCRDLATLGCSTTTYGLVCDPVCHLHRQKTSQCQTAWDPEAQSQCSLSHFCWAEHTGVFCCGVWPPPDDSVFRWFLQKLASLPHPDKEFLKNQPRIHQQHIHHRTLGVEVYTH